MSEEKSKVEKKEEEHNEFGVDLSKFSFSNASKRLSHKDSERRQHEAMKLIRVQISPNDDNKKNYEGEIFCVRNKVSEGVKKFVPFHRPTHIPTILYNMLKNKKCQKFRAEQTSNGSKVIIPYEMPAYNIAVLPPLTPEEFNAIRDRQLAEGRNL